MNFKFHIQRNSQKIWEWWEVAQHISALHPVLSAQRLTKPWTIPQFSWLWKETDTSPALLVFLSWMSRVTECTGEKQGKLGAGSMVLTQQMEIKAPETTLQLEKLIQSPSYSPSLEKVYGVPLFIPIQLTWALGWTLIRTSGQEHAQRFQQTPHPALAECPSSPATVQTTRKCTG